VGHFDGHGNVLLQCQAHHLMKHIHGYLRSHWTLPLGKHSPLITPADAIVIDSGVKN
jgi:hypothetical protein